jgi:hypothetical protein
MSPRSGVVAPLPVEQLHLQVVLDRDDAVHPLGGVLGLALLAEAAHGAAQRDATVVRRDGDRVVVELGVPVELVADVCGEVGVPGHWGLLS